MLELLQSLLESTIPHPLEQFSVDEFDQATQEDIIRSGHVGHMWDAELHVSSEFPVRQDVTVLPADDPQRLRMGWTIHEEVGIVVINDEAVSRITIGADDAERNSEGNFFMSLMQAM